jgi:phosphoribosylamine---glycine ligase
VCVVMASGGYPGAYNKGQTIYGLDSVAQLPNVKVFHAGTAAKGKEVVTNGGRVLGVTAWAPQLVAARSTAYEAVRGIQFDGAHWRTDIAAKALKSC